MRHLPATPEEMRERGWDALDVVLVTGDAHVDHPSFPAALLGRVLEADGFRVGVIPRPSSPEDVARLGLPMLFLGATAGALDSMAANYTALGRRRSDDAYASGGRAGGRPDRAVTAYCNMARRAFAKAAFVVAGGLEASLRRFAHYDFRSDSVRRPLLMDCGADAIVHGMGEGPVREIARRLAALRAVGGRRGFERNREGDPRLDAVRDVPGLVYREPASVPAPAGGVELPSAEVVAADPREHARAFGIQERCRDRVQHQECAGMRVVANPPWPALSEAEIDRIGGLPFTRDVHAIHRGARVPALEQVRFSVASHRGCCGGCAFCAIGAHQGKTVQSRSAGSILAEIGRIAAHDGFRGVVNDIGGPTANMYGARCAAPGPCERPSCLWPRRCRRLDANQDRLLEVLRSARRVAGVRRVFVTTGIRMDLATASDGFLRALASEHTSGRLKVAPEHVAPGVLACMRKPAGGRFERFLEAFRRLSREARREQYLLPYFMAAHPGCRMEDMVEAALFLRRAGLVVEQCQIFTPTPGTAAAVMYATGLDPATMQPVFVERDPRRKRLQKALLLHHLPENAAMVGEALRLCGRSDLEPVLLGRRERKRPRPARRRATRR